jgi:hypothetical protein
VRREIVVLAGFKLGAISSLFTPAVIAPEVTRDPKVPFVERLKLFCFAAVASLKVGPSGMVDAMLMDPAPTKTPRVYVGGEARNLLALEPSLKLNK